MEFERRDFTEIPRDSNNRDWECEVIKQNSFLKSGGGECQ